MVFNLFKCSSQLFHGHPPDLPCQFAVPLLFQRIAHQLLAHPEAFRKLTLHPVRHRDAAFLFFEIEGDGTIYTDVLVWANGRNVVAAYPNKDEDGLKRITNDYYNNEFLKEVGKSNFNYSSTDLKMNNKPSYFKGTTFSLPQSFDSLGNKQSQVLNSVSILRNSYSNKEKRNESVEKIFYNYNNSSNIYKSNLMNSSTVMPKFYTLDNGFTSGYKNGSPMARSYSMDNTRGKEGYKNIYDSVSNKPELYEKENAKPNYNNSFLNTSKYFQPNTQRDFHGVYDTNLRTSFINSKTNDFDMKNSTTSLYNSNKKLMFTLSPNIILNTIQEEQNKKELETFYQSNNTFFRDENEYTILKNFLSKNIITRHIIYLKIVIYLL